MELTRDELIWLAGYIDAHGYVHFKKEWNGRHHTTGMKVQVNRLRLHIHTHNRETSELLQEFIGIGGSLCARGQGNNETFTLVYTCANARELLGAVLEHLFLNQVKVRQALELDAKYVTPSEVA